MLLVAGDQAVVSAIRATPGIEPTDVVHVRDLDEVLAARAAGGAGLPPHLVVLGGASVLRKGATAAAGVERSHILVAPEVRAGTPEALGWAAEAARPAYLAKALGTPGSLPAERQAWRRGAVLIEHHRSQFGITDRRHPFGLEQTRGERARARADIERAVRVDRSAFRRRIDEPGLGLGR
jgi:hypothetical protein